MRLISLVAPLALLSLAACGGSATPPAAASAASSASAAKAASAGSTGGSTGSAANTSAGAGSAGSSTAAGANAAPSGSAASAASARPGGASAAGPATHVRLGIKLGGFSDAPIYIAMDRGYFQQQGIDLETVNFDSAARMIAPLGAEQIEVAAGATSANLYNAFNRQIPIKIVADKGSQPPGHGYEALVIRKDYIDSGKVKDYKDLKGLTVAIPVRGNTDEHAVALALEKGGLTLNDIKEVELSFPDMIPALANHSIDAALSLEPFVAKITGSGSGVRWKGVDEIAPNIQTANILYSPKFGASKDAATRWMVAYLKGVRDFNDAANKGTNKPRSWPSCRRPPNRMRPPRLRWSCPATTPTASSTSKAWPATRTSTLKRAWKNRRSILPR